MWSRVAAVFVSVTASCHAGLLGAGTGEGSCAAAPFRAPPRALKWAPEVGCPAGALCCSEYGYCRPPSEWIAGAFRDCNGISNGRPLAAEAIDAENAAAARGDLSAAGLIVVPAGGNPTTTGAVAVAAPAVAAPAVAYADAPVATVAGTGYGYAAAPAAVGSGYGYAAAVGTGYGYTAPAVIGTGYGYAAGTGYGYAAPAAVGTGSGYAANTPAGYAGAGYRVVPAANTGYILSGY